MPVILIDASPLMALAKLNRLGLLADLYGEVQTTRAVYDEVVTQGLSRGASDALTAPFLGTAEMADCRCARTSTFCLHAAGNSWPKRV